MADDQLIQLDDIQVSNPEPKNDQITQIEFGSIERIPTPAEYDDVTFDEALGIYTPPIEPDDLSDMMMANSYHGSIVEARARIIAKDFIENEYLTFGEMMNLAKDLVCFGQCGFQVFTNAFRVPVRLGHVPFQPMRRGKNNRFARLNEDTNQLTWFKPNEIYHTKLYDPKQNVYGIPDYLSGLESALLSQDATRFRRKYYLNGAHLGFILYTTDPNMTPEVEEELAKALKNSRGAGNFKSMLLNIPNGQEKGVQILPIGDIATKDEFPNIKNISAQDSMVAHRFPAGLSGIIPAQGSALGDPEKYNRTYYENEVRPMQKLLTGVNKIFGKPVIQFANPFKDEA